jgi:type II secretion system protein G
MLVRAKKGFTLIELLVVVAIIGILAALIIVNLSKARVKARDAKRMSDLSTLATAMAMYEDDNGKYNKGTKTLECNIGASGCLTELVAGGYMSTLPVPSSGTYSLAAPVADSSNSGFFHTTMEDKTKTGPYQGTGGDTWGNACRLTNSKPKYCVSY